MVSKSFRLGSRLPFSISERYPLEIPFSYASFSEVIPFWRLISEIRLPSFFASVFTFLGSLSANLARQ